MTTLTSLRALAFIAGASALPGSPGAAASPAPDYDFQWATIGAPGNEPYDGGFGGSFAGRGSVDHHYRMSRLEVTSAQWLEFINTFAPQSDRPQFFLRPSLSGLRPIGFTGLYELHPYIEDAGMLPVIGITWREAAMYVNWLHNGKSSEWEAMLDGAYDTSTFYINENGAFKDQPTRSPGARFWIPLLDEWMKAAYYDPNRFGEGEGGWWRYAHMSDDPPAPGFPDEGGETSAGLPLFMDPPAWHIPLGAYEDVQSPWGLFDVSGGASEWAEEFFFPDHPRSRFLGGARAGEDASLIELFDPIGYGSASFPNGGRGIAGLRVASVIPAPSGVFILLGAGFVGAATRHRRSHHGER